MAGRGSYVRLAGRLVTGTYYGRQCTGRLWQGIGSLTSVVVVTMLAYITVPCILDGMRNKRRVCYYCILCRVQCA